MLEHALAYSSPTKPWVAKHNIEKSAHNCIQHKRRICVVFKTDNHPFTNANVYKNAHTHKHAPRTYAHAIVIYNIALTYPYRTNQSWEQIWKIGSQLCPTQTARLRCARQCNAMHYPKMRKFRGRCSVRKILSVSINIKNKKKNLFFMTYNYNKYLWSKVWLKQLLYFRGWSSSVSMILSVKHINDIIYTSIFMIKCIINKNYILLRKCNE